MSRVKSFFLVLLAFSSVCFGATLMQLSVSRSSMAKILKEGNEGSPCSDFFEGEVSNPKKALQKLYNQAFKLSYDGHMYKAQRASECAAFLNNGSTRWKFETLDFIN